MHIREDCFAGFAIPSREAERVSEGLHRWVEATPVDRGQDGGMNPNQTLDIPVPRGATEDKTGIGIGTGSVDVNAYIDFQCPFCKQFELASGDIINQLLDQQVIRFIRHPMNFLDSASTNHYSTRAAAAAAAASDAGQFGEYARTLFENQPDEGGPGLTNDQLIALGEDVGTTNTVFADEIREGTYLPWPSFVTERAIARGVGGTPSVFVGGVAVAARPDLILAAVRRVMG
jgi:protein-disulfide isomerase